MLLDLSSDLLRSHGNPLARRSTMESRFLVDFAAGGGGDKVQFSDRGFAVVDLAITEKRQELLDAGGDGPVVLFMSLWSCPSDNSTVVVVYGLTIFPPPLLSVHVFPTSALLHVLEFRRRSTSGSVLVFVDVPFSALTLEFRSYMSQVLSFGSQRQQMSEQPRSVGSYLFGVIFWSSTYPSAAAEVIFLLAVLCVMSMRLVFRLRSYQVRVSVVFCASKSTVTSARKRVGFNSLAGLTGAMVMREGSGVAPKTWLRV
ncbi:hypothetical protein HID58_042495 [Brassica napus]|uniref:Uncharacterized protein n=3 Tax=Brassica TaxID=3705 RepID=A0ABQ8BEY0_BRANA|nr:hypothetical protein HID58_042495 [Brassica napus]